MKNRILTYRKYIDSLLQSEEDCDWKYIKQEHLTQVAFFQHERLVHLIVTITFAILELLTVCAYVIVGAIDSALSMPLLVLAIAILILLAVTISYPFSVSSILRLSHNSFSSSTTTIIISVPFHISCHTAYTFSAPRFQADSNA